MAQPLALRFKTFWQQSSGAFRSLLVSTVVAWLTFGLVFMTGQAIEAIFGTQPVNKVVDGINAGILIVFICLAGTGFLVSALSAPVVLWQERKRPSFRFLAALVLLVIYSIVWIHLRTISTDD